MVLIGLFQASFYNNWLQLKSGISTFEEFEMKSEQSVVQMMHRTQRDGLGSTGGLLASEGGGDPVYLSAFGLQGQFFCWLNVLLGGETEKNAELFRFFVALCSSALVSLFVLFARREWGWGAALGLLVGIQTSFWMVFAARNIYMLYFLKFLPFFVVWWLFPVFLERPKQKMGGLVLLTSLLVLLSALCYYDYLSNTVLGLVTAPLYYGIVRGIPWRRVARWSAAFVAGGGVALGVAVVANVAKVSLWAGSWAQGVGHLLAVVEARTYGTADAVRSAPVDVSFWDVWSGYWPLPILAWPFGAVETYTIGFSLFACLMAWLPLAALTGLDGRRFPVFEDSRTKLVGLAVATGWGLLAALSWGFLMKGHMAHHYHMNGMMFSLPYLLMLFLLAGAVGEAVVREAGRKLKTLEPRMHTD